MIRDHNFNTSWYPNTSRWIVNFLNNNNFHSVSLLEQEEKKALVLAIMKDEEESLDLTCSKDLTENLIKFIEKPDTAESLKSDLIKTILNNYELIIKRIFIDADEFLDRERNQRKTFFNEHKVADDQERYRDLKANQSNWR